MDLASSLFNPGNSLNLDLHNGIGLDNGKEEDEDAEEIKLKERELQDLLNTEFDDLIDEDECSSAESEDIPPVQQNNYVDGAFEKINDGIQTHRLWSTTKENETSTPKHPVPNWNSDWTPISNQEMTNTKSEAAHLDKIAISSPMEPRLFFEQNQYDFSPANGVDVAALSHQQRDNSSGETELSLSSDYQPVNANRQSSSLINHDREITISDGVHHQYAQDLVRMKEKIVNLQAESSQNIRLLKHQLTLSKGETESLNFSLKQARQVLLDREKELTEIRTNFDHLEQQFKEEKLKNTELQHQLEVSQSLAKSIEMQLTEMAKFESYAYLKDNKDKLIKDMELKHSEEINKLTRNLDSKEKEIDQLSKQVGLLEKYKEQSLPHKLLGIEQLTRNLETVENYCQRLLLTEALQDPTKAESEVFSTNNIGLLLNAISDLGGKLHNGTAVPLELHNKTIAGLELEKSSLQRELEIIKNECQDSTNKIATLSEENKKLRGIMETMIKKHEIDIKATIEKYHSLHSKETKILQEELDDRADEEKNRLREFYEEKLTTLYMENENLKSSLNDIKDLYVKVCEEKNALESEIQTAKLDSGTQNLQSKEGKQEMERLLESRIKKELSKAWHEREEEYFNKKNTEIAEIIESYKKEFIKREESLTQELASRTETYQKQIKELEKQLERNKTVLLQQQNELRCINEKFKQEWAFRYNEIQTVYNAKLDEIIHAQKEELDNVMVDVEKAVAEKEKEFLNQQALITRNLKEKINQLQKEVFTLKIPKERKNASVNVTLPSLKDESLLRQMEEKLNFMYLKEQQRTKNLRNSTSQTEEKLIPKKSVIELNNLYHDVIQQMKDEVEAFTENSNVTATEHLRCTIIKYYKEFSKK